MPFVIDPSQAADEAQKRTQGLTGLLPRELPMGGVVCAAPLSEAMPLIPKIEWADRIKAMDASRGWVNDRRRALSARLGKSVVKDQDGLGYCHVFALTNCVEALRDREGLPYVELAPESLGGVVGWQNAGGMMDADIAWAARHGIAARKFCPPWKHNPTQFVAGWQESAVLHAPTEWFELGSSGDMWGEVVTALLLGMPLYAGWAWWSHSVMGGKLVVIDGEVCLEIENSWGDWGAAGYGVLKGSKKVPSEGYGCFAPRVVTWAGGAA